MNIKDIEELLSQVEHPAKGKNIIALKMVEDLKIDGDKIRFKLVSPSPDALSSSIKKECEKVLGERFKGYQVRIIELIREARPKKEDGLDLGQEELESVNKIIAIASGKGGVGKSTIAVNTAVALAKLGYKVGLADADIYGPSVPKMTGTEGAVPNIVQENGIDLIIPIEKYGVRWMSIGYFTPQDQALIWRGPMACNALKQMVLQVKWGELDFLLIDLPPGTGDIHISLVHDIPLTGVVVVSTPQAVALADVEKGVNMFRNKDINKPIIGLVENMAWFTPAELPNNKYYIFGKEGCKAMAEKFNLPLLAQIPIIQSIRESGDDGIPSAFIDGVESESFATLAKQIAEIA